MKRSLHTVGGSLLFLTLIFFTWSLLYASTVELPEFEILTEPFYPYQFKEDGTIKGVSVDLLLLMLKRAGSSQGRDDITMLPWARGYFMAQVRENSLLFSTTRTPEREDLFKWVGPIFKNTMFLIAKKQKHIKITHPEELRDYTIGTVRDDVGELYLKALGVSISQFTRNNTNTGNIRMLDLGRVQLVAQSWNLFAQEARSIGLHPRDFEPVYTLHTDDLYYAFHRQTPDRVIRTLQNTFNALKAEGVLEQIKKGYGVHN